MNRITYQSLRAQMALRGYSIGTLAQAVSIKYNTLCRKMRGENEFTLAEAVRIKQVLRYGGELEALFGAGEEQACA